LRVAITTHQIAPLKGIAFMVMSAFMMNLNNAVLKLMAEGFPIGQIIFMRAVFVLVAPLFVLVWINGGWDALRVNDLKVHLLRAACVSASVIFFILGLIYLPLADTVAITFVGPLLLAALAGPVLGENVGWRRWSAVIAGFAGILIIMRPTGDVIRFAVFLPLASAFLAASRDLITRRITASESSTALMMTTYICNGLVGLCTVPFGLYEAAHPGTFVTGFGPWMMPDMAALGISFLGALFVSVGHYCMIEGFRYAEASTVAPFRYTAIVWAGLLGYLLWGHLPDAWTVTGTTIVIMSGLYILRREYIHRHAPENAHR
jgi:drug/metabolite transporter (DMT)-like permease